MKKSIIFLLLTLTSLLNAQTTTVTATVVDSDGTTWANGTWSLVFLPNPNQPNINIYNINGTPLSHSVLFQNGTLNNSGQLSLTNYQNGVISPSGSSWSITVCPNASTQCGVYNFTTAQNSSLNISTPLNAVIPAPRFKAVAGAYGYNNTEAQILTIPGSTYFDVTLGCQKYYTGSLWGCPIPSTGGSVASLNKTIYADQQPGANATAQIANACSQLPNGGVIDLTGYGATTQTVNNVTCGSTAAPVSLKSSSATNWIPASISANMFVLVDGMSLDGTFNANVTSVSGYTGVAFSTSPNTNIPANNSITTSHIQNINCFGSGNTTGVCLELTANSTHHISFLNIGSVQVTGMLYGVYAFANETIGGVSAFVNGNYIYNVTCSGTQICEKLFSNGTITGSSVSENHFLATQTEMLQIVGISALNASTSGAGGSIIANDFLSFTLFDAGAGAVPIVFGPSGVKSNDIIGALCLNSCGGGTYTDSTGNNSVIDCSVYGQCVQLNTSFNIVSSTAIVTGSFSPTGTGPQLLLPGSNQFNITSGNGGIGFIGGSGADHNTYIKSLDLSGTQFFFNLPLNSAQLQTRNNTSFGGVGVGQGDTTHVGNIVFENTSGASVSQIGGDLISANTLSIIPPSGGTSNQGNLHLLSGTGGQIGAMNTPDCTISPTWTSMTPTLTSDGGSFGSASSSGGYFQCGKWTTFYLSITITTVGGASGFMYATTPFSVLASSLQTVNCSDTTGHLILFSSYGASNNQVIVSLSGGNTAIAAGHTYTCNGSVRTQ